MNVSSLVVPTYRVSTHAIPGLTPVLLSGSSSGLLVVVVVVVVVPAGSPAIHPAANAQGGGHPSSSRDVMETH